MANRRLQQFQLSYQRIPINAWVKVTFGSTGAPTLTANPLVSAIVRNSAGDYTLTLRDMFKQGVIGADWIFVKSASAPSSPNMRIKADNSNSSTKTIGIVFDAAGTATDPASGEVVLICFSFNDQSITY